MKLYTQLNFGGLCEEAFRCRITDDVPPERFQKMRHVYLRVARLALGAAALMLAVGSCSPSTSGPSFTGGPGGGGTPNSISVRDNYFTPATISVKAGSTVTWTWAGRNDHSVTFSDGTTSTTQSSGVYSRTFPTAGTYNYHCAVHGASMSASVTVQ